MRRIKNIPLVLAGVLFFIAGLWVWTPWYSVAEYALTRAQVVAAKNGFYLSSARSQVYGIMRPAVRLDGVLLDQSYVNLELDYLEIRFLPLSTLLNRKATFGIEAGAARLKSLPGMDSGWDKGRARVSVAPGVLIMSGVDIKGDISLSGALQLEKGKIIKGTLALKVPTEMHEAVGMLAPLMRMESTAPGEWRMQDVDKR